MTKKLSEQLQDAYMVGNKELIEKLLKEINDKSTLLQKKHSVTPLTVNTVFNNDNSSCLKIYDFLNLSLGEDWWELEFETIEKMLWIKYGAALDDANTDKVWGIKYLCNNQRCFLEWYSFNQVAVSLSGCIADFEVLRTPSPGMIINAVDIMRSIRPEESFSREVKKYICIILINEGIYAPPPSIADLVADEFEPLINNFDKKDWPEIYSKYKEMLESKKYEIGESHIEIQARRLLVAEGAAMEYAQ